MQIVSLGDNLQIKKKYLLILSSVIIAQRVVKVKPKIYYGSTAPLLFSMYYALQIDYTVHVDNLSFVWVLTSLYMYVLKINVLKRSFPLFFSYHANACFRLAVRKSVFSLFFFYLYLMTL